MPAQRRASSSAPRLLSLAFTALLALPHAGCAARAAGAPGAARADAADVRGFRIADEDLDRDPRAVGPDEALADLAEAARIFEEAYAGVDGAPRTPSEAALAAAQARIRGEARWEPAELARLLRDLFQTPDGHLRFGYGGRAPLWLTAVPPRPPATPSIEGPARAERRPASIELVAARAAPASGPPVSLTRRGGVPVLAIRTFDSAAAEALERLPQLAAELRRAPAFVVDLRGNAGGNFRYAERFLMALTDEPVRRLDEREVLSVAAAEGRANSARRRLLRGDVPEEAEPRFLEHIAALEALAEDLRERGAPRRDVVRAGGTARGGAAGPLRSRAVLLVDGGCASACEMLLALARQLPAAIVAGQATRGGMAVGEVALFRLSGSGILISLGTRAFRDPLGDFEETRGFAPDVWIDAPDPVAAAVGLARQPSDGGAIARR